MTEKWKDRAMGGMIALVIAIVPVLLSFSIATKQNKEKILEEIDKSKVSVVDYKEDKKDMISYVDKQNDILRKELDSKLNLILSNQQQMNDMLKEIRK